jgi:hypothetical protein
MVRMKERPFGFGHHRLSFDSFVLVVFHSFLR